MYLAEFYLLIKESKISYRHLSSTINNLMLGEAFIISQENKMKQETNSLVDRKDVSYTLLNVWNLARIGLLISQSVKKIVLHAFLLTFILHSFLARLCAFSTVHMKKKKDFYSFKKVFQLLLFPFLLFVLYIKHLKIFVWLSRNLLKYFQMMSEGKNWILLVTEQHRYQESPALLSF